MRKLLLLLVVVAACVALWHRDEIATRLPEITIGYDSETKGFYFPSDLERDRFSPDISEPVDEEILKQRDEDYLAGKD